LETIADTAGLNSVSLAQSYHVSTYLLPRNPRRPLYWGEEGALYFQPSDTFYRESPIEPLISNVVTSPGYMSKIVDKIKTRGLDFTSWLVFNYNHHLPQRYPDAAKQDAFGHTNLAQLCPASPLTRDYALALCREIARQFEPDEFHLESLAYLHFNYGFRNPKIAVKITPLCEMLMGLCYCRHCLDRAGEAGIEDAERFRAEIAEFLADELAREPNANDTQPLDPATMAKLFSGRLQVFIDTRIEAATSLMEQAVDIALQSGARASFFGGRDPIRNGLDSDRALREVYMVNGGVDTITETIAANIADQRRAFPSDTGFSAIVQASSFADAGAFAAYVSGLHQAGIDGFAFYNYGLLRRVHLEWIGGQRHAWS
jgi:hypothetical protein